MPSAEEQLASLIDSFEDGSLAFDQFSKEFSDTYLDLADDLGDTEVGRFFDAVHERLEWTAPSPPAEDRAYGWGDPNDFRAWLTDNRRNRGS